ncbi:unnamed protein product [Adineta ricciae]|uniref:Guanine nucleotide-binding protein subunit alpha n=1 Tax=Adineta ricciae TaxID=249248 RepID=A0A814L8Z3_ADIRI|nr:unnamed protein product [Adineta ricciae]CAF1237803.1 unnamed protein product [Adineta ricciae]
MMCCASFKARSQRKKHQRQEEKLLVLGIEGSGKSTLTKQMLMFLDKDYLEKNKHSFVKVVYENIFMAVQSMIRAMDTLKISYRNKINEKNAALLQSIDYQTMTSLQPKYVEAMKNLWSDYGIKECYQRRNEYEVIDSVKYFLDDIDRISSPDYLVNKQDVLHIREATNGIVEYPIDLDGVPIRIIDTSGQRSEYRKWIHHFENVTAIIFLLALNQYDNEDAMEESKTLFCSAMTSPWSKNSPVILMLNKKDLFEEKIMHSHLVDHFPEFDGPKRDAQAAREFLLRTFVDLNTNSDRYIYSHFSCATDIGDAQFVVYIVKVAILQANLKNVSIS